MIRQRIRLSTPTPFELRLTAFGHGWVDLAPYAWDDETGSLATVLRVDALAVDARIGERADQLHVELASARRLTRGELAEARAALRRMLRLDEDLSEFWRLCDETLGWVARRGAGRLLRSQSVFEDLVKLLCTTNCSWAATRNMVGRMVQALGKPTSRGNRAFPLAAELAEKPERFFRERVRAGYRAKALCALARGFARGELSEAHFTTPDTDELRRRLLDLQGFGPYAAGQALRLLGHYDDLALDSWCRSRLAARHPSGRCPSDRTIARKYRHFAHYQGLALWMDLTAHWHAEARPDGARARPLAVQR